MELTAAMRERDRRDFDRVEQAKENPNRRDFSDPLDHRLECSIGRLRVRGRISEPEYQAGVRWRTIYSAYLHSIQSPDELSDDDCERALAAYQRGLLILDECGRRVRHAVNALAVFEEPEELGDFEYTVGAATIGLAALAASL